uniref:Uncharacterized protein n=1 Tax=Opuntia streptacantha TaxID=393608 RepID=A0A7C9DJ81_OPUST
MLSWTCCGITSPDDSPSSPVLYAELSGTRSMQIFFPCNRLLDVTVTSAICLNLLFRTPARPKLSCIETGFSESLSNLGVGSRHSFGCRAFNIRDSTSIRSP